MFMFTLYQLIS